jgi:hypothetical protein
MADKSDKPPPNLSPAGHRAKAENEARQAAALRENLARRKQQQRARAAASTPEPVSTPKPGKGIAG